MLTPPPSPKHEVLERTGISAGFVSRTVASILDLIVILVLAGVTYLLISGTMRLLRIDLFECRQFVAFTDVRSIFTNFCALSRILAIITILSIAPLYYLSLWLFAGRTIGMGIVGLRVVRTNGRKLGLSTAIIRLVGFTLSLLTLGLGFLWAIFDDERQALHDKMARTYVIYWTGTQLHPPPVQLPAKTGKAPEPMATLGGGSVNAPVEPASSSMEKAQV